MKLQVTRPVTALRVGLVFSLAVGVSIACVRIPKSNSLVKSANSGKNVALAPIEFSKGPLMRHIQDVDPVSSMVEKMRKLKDAKVVVANYALLRADFAELKNMTDAQIDQWLVDRVGYISIPQFDQHRRFEKGSRKDEPVNSPIAGTGKFGYAYRPHRYGRAHVFAIDQKVFDEGKAVYERAPREEIGQAEPGGATLIDVKGTGKGDLNQWGQQKTPKDGSHGNGLLELGAAIAEYSFATLVNGVLRESNMDAWVVPHYGVVDLGFNVIFKNEEGQKWETPAGAVLRRAHRRTEDGDSVTKGSDKYEMGLQIEMALRKFGISSSWGPSKAIGLVDGKPYLHWRGDREISDEEMDKFNRLAKPAGLYDSGKVEWDSINIQMAREMNAATKSAQILDFGAFSVRQDFTFPLARYAGRSYLAVGEQILFNDPRFIQPDKNRRVPYNVWGQTGEAMGFKADDVFVGAPRAVFKHNSNIVGFGLAKGLRDQTFTTDDVKSCVNMFINAGLSFKPEVTGLKCEGTAQSR